MGIGVECEQVIRTWKGIEKGKRHPRCKTDINKCVEVPDWWLLEGALTALFNRPGTLGKRPTGIYSLFSASILDAFIPLFLVVLRVTDLILTTFWSHFEFDRR